MLNLVNSSFSNRPYDNNPINTFRGEKVAWRIYELSDNRYKELNFGSSFHILNICEASPKAFMNFPLILFLSQLVYVHNSQHWVEL